MSDKPTQQGQGPQFAPADQARILLAQTQTFLVARFVHWNTTLPPSAVSADPEEPAILRYGAPVYQRFALITDDDPDQVRLGVQTRERTWFGGMRFEVYVWQHWLTFVMPQFNFINVRIPIKGFSLPLRSDHARALKSATTLQLVPVTANAGRFEPPGRPIADPVPIAHSDPKQVFRDDRQSQSKNLSVRVGRIL
jgi:hypothetical protein